jgi:hypothetical protein
MFAIIAAFGLVMAKVAVLPIVPASHSGSSQSTDLQRRTEQASLAIPKKQDVFKKLKLSWLDLIFLHFFSYVHELSKLALHNSSKVLCCKHCREKHH